MPFFTVPTTTLAGTYKIKSVLLTGINSDNVTTFNRNIENNSDVYAPFDNNSTFNVTDAKASETLNLTAFSILSNSIKVGDKVYINFATNEPAESVKVFFTSSSGSTISSYVKSVSSSPYFIVNSSVTPGNYRLSYILVESESGIKTFDGVNGVTFSSYMFVHENDNETYVYDNSDIDATVTSKFASATEGSTIYIDATDNSVVSSNVFSAIEKKNIDLVIENGVNEIEFNGLDINEAKVIDAKISVYAYDGLVDTFNDIEMPMIAVDFEPNGDLPGNAKIRIKDTAELENIFETKANFLVYYYDDLTGEYTEEVETASYNDGYYEFEINHNSIFLLTYSRLPDDVLNNENTVDFQKSTNINLIIIVIGGTIVIILMVMLIALEEKKEKEKKKGKKKEEKNKPIIEEDNKAENKEEDKQKDIKN